MIKTLTLNSKNQIVNLESIEKSLKRPGKKLIFKIIIYNFSYVFLNLLHN